MRLAVTSDKARHALNIPGFPIASKTGTAEVGSKKQFMNSWVIGFWPYDKPRYAFVVVSSGHLRGRFRVPHRPCVVLTGSHSA